MRPTRVHGEHVPIAAHTFTRHGRNGEEAPRRRIRPAKRRRALRKCSDRTCGISFNSRAVGANIREHSVPKSPMIRSKPRTRWLLAVALAIFLATATGCAVDEADLARWETTLGGPNRLLAVVRYDKYDHDLRVRAAMSLIHMKPRKGERIGIKILVEGTDVEGKHVPGLAGMDPDARAKILADLIPLLIEELEKPPPVAQAGQPLPPDESFQYKDAAFLMLTHEKKEIIQDKALVGKLKEVLTNWAMADFSRRLNDRSQMYGMEQLIRYIGSDSVRRLPALMNKDTDARDLAKMCGLVAKFADDETLEAVSEAMVTIVKYGASDKWREDHADELKMGNERAGFEPTEKQFGQQLKDYQKESVKRVYTSMKRVGGAAIVAYCLGVAQDGKQTPKQRQIALAALEGHIDRNDKKSIGVILKIAGSDAPDVVLDQAFRRIKGLPRDKVASDLYELFKTDKWRIRRAAATALLAMSAVKHIDEFLAKLDANARKNFNMDEALKYANFMTKLKDGEPLKTLEPHFKKGNVPSRLTAMSYYFWKGKKEDVDKVKAFVEDDTKVPKCEDDGGCFWKCSVIEKGKEVPKEIETVGAFVEHCLIPRMKRNSEAKKVKKDGGATEKKDDKGDKEEKRDGE